jgi:uncharacterized protein YgfB (UPF0149 family)
MTATTDLPDIDMVAGELNRLRLDVHPSEAHGALCGLVCGDNRAQFAAWVGALASASCTAVALDPEAAARLEEHSVLGQLYRATGEQLQDSEFGFMLLLPDDERMMAERADALASWCRGFLFGLGSSGVGELTDASTELREIIDDMMEISRLSGDDAQVGEEEERAFMELEEYVRVGALLAWAELRQRSLGEQTSTPRIH